VNRMIASVFIPLIVIALIFGAYLGNVLSSPSADILPSSSSVCNTYYDYDASNPISVLVINSGSTGKICVKYTNSFNNSISLPSYIAVYEYNSSTNYPQLNPISY